jgi:TRAP-type transport system periplasmic protein
MTSAAGLRGLKVHVLLAPNFVATLKLMGAVAAPIPFGEICTAPQTGVVDSVEQDAPTLLAGKFYEVAKH